MNTLVGLSPISANGPATTAYLSTSMTFGQFRYVGTLQKFFWSSCGAPFLWGPCSAEHAELVRRMQKATANKRMRNGTKEFTFSLADSVYL